MKWYIKVLKNYVNFSGRARRMEFWMFTLINGIISLILTVAVYKGMDMPTPEQIEQLGPQAFESMSLGPMYYISTLYSLATFLPTLAVTVRRLHDTDRSGWWVLIAFIPLGAIVLLIFMVFESNYGSNRFGPNPLDEEEGFADDGYDERPQRNRRYDDGRRRGDDRRHHNDHQSSNSYRPSENTWQSDIPQDRPSRSAETDHRDPFKRPDSTDDHDKFARFGLIDEEPTPPDNSSGGRRGSKRNR